MMNIDSPIRFVISGIKLMMEEIASENFCPVTTKASSMLIIKIIVIRGVVA
jgi:hypothetical protein